MNSPYLPQQGTYKPTTVAGTSTYGYPWQRNPLFHKSTSEPFLCRSRHVFRRYADNKVVYTRTAQQLANGLYTYYLYDDNASVTETGEVALPFLITDDNWHMYKYQSPKDHADFIHSLGIRTNVMVATYHPTQSTTSGAFLPYYPVTGISCYDAITTDTPTDDYGQYLTENEVTHYSFIHHSKEEVAVSITVLQPIIQLIQPIEQETSPSAPLPNTSVAVTAAFYAAVTPVSIVASTATTIPTPSAPGLADLTPVAHQPNTDHHHTPVASIPVPITLLQARRRQSLSVQPQVSRNGKLQLPIIIPWETIRSTRHYSNAQNRNHTHNYYSAPHQSFYATPQAETTSIQAEYTHPYRHAPGTVAATASLHTTLSTVVAIPVATAPP